MKRRRLNLFVLLFVLGLIVLSGLAVVNKPTRLGLDLKGGVELVYQGTPSGQATEVTGEDIDRAIEIIRERIDRLGVAEPEVSRLGEAEISVALPDVTNAQRAIDQVGSTAQLYFYDWEPNLIGRERAIAGNPGREPPQAAIAAASREWEEAGRNPAQGANRQLLVSGAFPTAYGAVKLASEQEPDPECTEHTTNRTRFYLFDDDRKLLAGPESERDDLYLTATGTERKREGEVIAVPPGTVVASQLPSDQSGKVLEDADPGWYALRDCPALSGAEITDPRQEFDELQRPNVTFSFTSKGRQAFQEVTRRIAQRGQARAIGPASGEQAEQLSGRFAVVLDNEIKTAPIINFAENPDGIDGRTGAQISGGFTSIAEAQDLATFLQIGALPISLKLISQTQVSATLGSQALDAGIKAGAIAFVLVILFLVLFYRGLGVIASAALVAYGTIFFALIKLVPVTLTLPGIAGLVLTVGIAADSNIVIFERIKEEVRAGRGLTSAIGVGYRRGISTIIDANVVTLLTAFVLFVLATAGVKGFAFMLGIGTIVSLLTAVVFTQALLGTMSRTPLLQSASLLGAAKPRMRWRFDFMGKSRWLFSASGVILAIGAFSLATNQLNFGIDFESGTRITAALEQPTDEPGVRAALEEAGIEVSEVQQVSDPVRGENVFQISARELEPETVKLAENALQDELGIESDGFDSTSVGPTFGQQVADSAMKALIFSLLVICGYIAFRFEPKFAVPVLIAVFHDLLITAGIYSLSGREVTSGTVAALLTIIGYSLYDCVIVFDRIRENLPRMPRAAFSQVVNRSMSEVLTRSLATTFTTLLAVVALFIFGSPTLKDFAFAMMIGIASGTYSSIFIASPVLTAWKELEPGFVRRRERIAAIAGGRVPAFADEIELARLDDDSATDAEIEELLERSTVEAEAGPDGGGDPTANGEPAAVADPGAALRRERAEKRRERRRQRRKHGRNR